MAWRVWLLWLAVICRRDRLQRAALRWAVDARVRAIKKARGEAVVEFYLPLWRRLYWSWKLKVWPWNVPDGVKWIAIDQRLTPREIAHGQRLAKKYGWK